MYTTQKVGYNYGQLMWIDDMAKNKQSKYVRRYYGKDYNNNLKRLLIITKFDIHEN